MFATNSMAEYGGVKIHGGRPIVVVFPLPHEVIVPASKDFVINTTVFRDVDTGLVSRVWIETEKGGFWSDEEKLNDDFPRWQLPYLESIHDALKKWKFEKTIRVGSHSRNDSDDKLDQNVGRAYSFRFIHDADNSLKRIQISDNRGIIADNAPE